ncbi:MAG: acyl carrier protein [Candidatus Bipolaricaulia bacterium]
MDDLGADSLDVIAMVTEFEEGFEVEIPNEDIPKLQTVGDAITYVVGLLG